MQRQQGEALLKQMLGADAEFRSGQWQAIDLIANGRKRLLVVQRTGWGKSVVYFLATKILRQNGTGPTLLISPLLALMRNQVLMTERLGLVAQTMNCENREEWERIKTALRENQCDLLLVSPERLGNPEFMETVLPLFHGKPGLFVVDEAHCISDWGHDFRPDYRRIVRIVRLLPPQVPVLCTTATANNRVARDIAAQIPGIELLRGPLVRPSLKLFNIKLEDQADRLAWLAHFLPQLPGTGIIYCLTIPDTRRVADWLRRRGIETLPYHADLEGSERVEVEKKLLANQVKVVVATVALGMGYDKPDLGFVIHFQRPGSPVAYYQQVGRAGRAVESAYGILLSGREDDEIQEYFIHTAFPPAETMQNILRLLESNGGEFTVNEIAAEINVSYGTIERALKLLEVDGAVERRRMRVSRTANPWKPDWGRSQAVTQQRLSELEEIRRYVDHSGCLMEFLAHSLDDPTAQRCGKCMNCAQQTHRRAVPASLVQEAVTFLRGDFQALPARCQWPKAVLKEVSSALPAAVEAHKDGHLKLTIPENLRPQPGGILSIYGDAGWGRLVASGKYGKIRFDDALVEAAARMVLDHWKPDPPPKWIAAIPSLRHVSLVRDFAARLAARMSLPYVDALTKLKETPPQKEMANGATQLRNVLDAFGVKDPVSADPVLLVDDVVDSGWTLTCAGIMLRLRGSGPVYPFALAKATPKGS